MNVSLNMLLFICGAGILQAALLSLIILFYPDSERSVIKFLAFYIVCFCIPMLTPIIQHFFSWQLLILLDPFPLLSGPMLYFYIRSFKEEITWSKAWPHLVIFFLYVLLDIGLFLDFVRRFPWSHTIPVQVLHHPSSVVRVSGRIIQMILYFFLARKELSMYQLSIQQLFSETSNIDLKWARWLINGYVMLVLLMVALYLMILQFPEKFHWFILINTACVTPYLYMMTFKGITQPTLWKFRKTDKKITQEALHQAEIQGEVEELKASRPSIDRDKLRDITNRILQLMNERKIFLQSELSLQDLSDRLQLPSYLVSQALNEGMNKTFYDLVNACRVEEAKRLLVDPRTKNSKILTIGFESGFKSKTTFNTVFKKFTGVTPSEFRQQREELIHA